LLNEKKSVPLIEIKICKLIKMKTIHSTKPKKAVWQYMSVWLTVLTGMLCPLTSNAQNFEWAKRWGGADTDIATSITTDASGNVYTIGLFYGTVDFDPGTGTYNLTSVGSRDIFISKLDASGNLVWSKQLGGTDSDEGTSITTDASGNVYITGSFWATADFDPGTGTYNLTSAGYCDAFISKLDASGNMVWAKQLGGTDYERGKSIIIDDSGNVYTTGEFRETADFDPGTGTYNLTSAGDYDIFISKLDTSGFMVWAKQMGGTSTEASSSIAADASGNVYTTGYFNGIADFDPGTGTYNLTSAGEYDIFISKLDASGNLVWAKQLGGTSYDGGTSIATDASGNVYTTGYFYGTVDFDPGNETYNLTSAGGYDIFISKLDTSGFMVWTNQMGGTSNDEGTSIATDASGNVYTIGKFEATADFDPGNETYNLTSAGDKDIFISKLDTSGFMVWAKQLGGTSSDVGRSIILDASGNIYITGYFNGIADFDPGVGIYNLTSAGGYDSFVLKMNQSTVGISENSFGNTLQIYPNPTNGTFVIEIEETTTVAIFDTMGRRIFEKQLNIGKNTIDLREQITGIYFTKIVLNNKFSSEKIILNR